MGAARSSPPSRSVVTVVVAVAVAMGVGFGVRQLFAHRAARPGAGAGAGAGAGQGAARRAGPLGGPAGEVLHVPHLPGSITLDGDCDDPGWTASPGPARTGPFVLENGAEARPYSNARMLWGDGYLYFSLYAADEDIHTRTDQPDGPVWLDDSFRLEFTNGGTQYAIEISPRGTVTDA